jgi:hypothetical protein
MFWQELNDLKVACFYVREYRNSLNKWVTGVATLRAISSSVSIAAWAIWQKHALIWGSIIALSQVADALKDVFPFAKRKTVLSRWSRTLDALFVNAQRDWDQIAGGRCTNPQIRVLLHRLRTKRNKAEARYIPEGLSHRPQLYARAEQEAEIFFRLKFRSIVKPGDKDAEEPGELDTPRLG